VLWWWFVVWCGCAVVVVCCGSVVVLLSFNCGFVVVQLWFCCRSVVVQLWFNCGSKLCFQSLPPPTHSIKTNIDGLLAKADALPPGPDVVLERISLLPPVMALEDQDCRMHVPGE
jgi:hypothetical protein